MAEAVRYLPCLGSEAHIMFLASNICWVSSGTVRALYCWDPLEVRGANPTMKKWEWDQVNSELSEIGVQLSWESEAACNTGDGG